MRDVEIKRIYDGACPRRRPRVLVDRLWPRGITKERAHLDEWSQDVAPSTELRKWFSHDPKRMGEFRRDTCMNYMQRITRTQGARKGVGEGSCVTLLYAAHDPKTNHAIVLKEAIEALK